jgi:hypothetical protein
MSEQAMAFELEALVVEVGHEELEHGRVRAEFRADGQLLVDKRVEGKADRFEHRVEKDEAEQTLRSADELARLAPRDRRDYRPVPDEARYEIEIRRGGEEPLKLEFWQNELDENDAARRLIQSLAQQVQRASDGQALL